jgi:hypothetical protein
MGALVLASVWVWMIIVSFSLRMASAERKCDTYETALLGSPRCRCLPQGKWRQGRPERARGDGGAAAEWRRSTSGRTIDREGTRQRLNSAMESVVTAEADRMAGRLQLPCNGGLGSAVRRAVRHRVGHHGQLLRHRRAAELLARGGCAGHFGGAVRHGHRPVSRRSRR